MSSVTVPGHADPNPRHAGVFLANLLLLIGKERSAAMDRRSSRTHPRIGATPGR